MANISSINGNPIVPSDGSVGTAQIADGSIGDDKLEQSGGILSRVRAIDDKLTRISQGDGGGIADDSVAAAALRAEDAAERAEAAAKSVDLTGYLKSTDAEATYAPKSQVSALRTRMDDAESSIAHLAGRLPIYYYTDVPSESSITEKPQLAVIKGGAVYLVE